MDRKGRFMEEAERLLREVMTRVSREDWIKSRLGWEDWERLTREARRLAARELKRRRWRGVKGGLAPRGYDAESVAAEVSLEMLKGNARLAPGWTYQRLVKELERMIVVKVRSLGALKETEMLRNEWDLAPQNGDGEAVSVLPEVPDPGPNGYEAAVEAEEGRQRIFERMGRLLEGKAELQRVLGCIRDGVTRTVDIAQRLGMPQKAVLLARKRLVRWLERQGGNGAGELVRSNHR